MDRKPVKSSNIVSIGFNSATNEMEIEFANGAIHRYAAVTADAHHALINADSIGKHFHQHIRPHYQSTKV